MAEPFVLKFPTPESMKTQIDAYFVYAKENKKPFIKSGMCVFLGITYLTLKRYSEMEDYKLIIEEAYSKCEEWIVENMLLNNSNATAAIFNLKNSFGWKDQAQLDLTTNGKELYSPEQLKEAAKEFLNSSENDEEDSIHKD